MQKVEGGVDEAMKINRKATRGPVVSKQHSTFPALPPISRSTHRLYVIDPPHVQVLQARRYIYFKAAISPLLLLHGELETSTALHAPGSK